MAELTKELLMELWRIKKERLTIEYCYWSFLSVIVTISGILTIIIIRA